MVSCEEIYPGCTSNVRAILGNGWKYGKALFEIQGQPNRYPSWTPNTWTSICILLKSNEQKIYINNELVAESSHPITNSIQSFR